MCFIIDKHVVGKVGSYCQLAVTFFFLVSPYQTRQCSALTPFSINLDPPLKTEHDPSPQKKNQGSS